MDITRLVVGLRHEELNAELKVLALRRQGCRSEVRLIYEGAYGPMVKLLLLAHRQARPERRFSMEQTLEDICTQFWEMIRVVEEGFRGSPQRNWKVKLTETRYGGRLSLKIRAELHAHMYARGNL